MKLATLTPRVSVIVPVRNGARDIRELLDCLERQTLGRDEFEIIIGDDGSTDGGTDDIETDDGHHRVVRGPARNAYAARNRAVAASRTQRLAFCDADCRPAPGWLEAGLDALQAADLVAGRIRFAMPARPSIWSLLDAETTKNHEQQVKLGNAETANLFTYRSLFDAVGGFDERQPGYGDFDFVERAIAAGARLVFDENALVEHPVRTDAVAFLRNVWSMNASYATLEARRGLRPEGLRPREWIPVVQTLRSRRRFGVPLGLDRRWLGQSGAQPTLLDDLQALPLTYLVLPYLRVAAQASGWRRGRRERGTDGVASD